MTRREPGKFNRSAPLEEALTLLFGINLRKPTRWQEQAGAFYEGENVSKAIKDACRRMRNSIEKNIIADDRLKVLIRRDLDGLERSAKAIKSKDGALIDSIGYLIKLSGHLLGYDSDRGKPVRHLFYVFNKHRHCDFSLVNPGINPPVYNKRVELINQMWKQGMSIEQIAEIMNLAVKSVNSILIRIGDAERISAGCTLHTSVSDEAAMSYRGK